MNVYLTAAMMLGAGLDGIEQGMDPGDPIDLNMYLQSDDDLRRLGVRTLLEAVEAFAADDLGRRVMGEELFRSCAQLKEREWWDYHNTVSEWEIDRDLTKF